MKKSEIVLIIGNIIFWAIASIALLNIMYDIGIMVKLIADVVLK